MYGGRQNRRYDSGSPGVRGLRISRFFLSSSSSLWTYGAFYFFSNSGHHEARCGSRRSVAFNFPVLFWLTAGRLVAKTTMSAFLIRLCVRKHREGHAHATRSPPRNISAGESIQRSICVRMRTHCTRALGSVALFPRFFYANATCCGSGWRMLGATYL